MHSNTPTRWWRMIVKDQLQLNITQYSLKKLSGDDMVRLQYENRINNLLDIAQMQMGHTTAQMTEVYTNEHKRILQEVVKRKMPVL